jgi:beta-phosphoglucomutase
MIKACLFDLDGVIVDTARYHFIAWRNLANDLGIDFDEKENENLKGVGRMESLEYILSLGGIYKSDHEKELLAAKKNDQYKMLIEQIGPSEILPGVEDFLGELKSANILIGLGSSSKNARPVLSYLGIKTYFDVIVDGTDISKSKPDPEVFIRGAEALSIAPSETVVFEDARAGVEAARTGGFMSIGVGDPVELGIADHVINGFVDFNLEKMKNILLNQ